MKKLFDSEESRTHLAYCWWMYVLGAVLICLVWHCAFSFRYRNRDYEMLRLCYMGTELDTEGLEKQLTEDLSSYTDQAIRDITVEYKEYDASDYTCSLVLMTRCADGTDWILLPEKVMTDLGNLSTLFTYLDEAAVKEAFGNDVELWYEEGHLLGIRVDGNTRFSAYYSGTGPCYAFLAGSSVNAGTWTESGEGYTAAIDLMQYLLEEP